MYTIDLGFHKDLWAGTTESDAAFTSCHLTLVFTYHIVEINIFLKMKYILIQCSLVSPAKIGKTHIDLNCIFRSNAHILSHASAIGRRLRRDSILSGGSQAQIVKTAAS